jgi:hypothetical protein
MGKNDLQSTPPRVPFLCGRSFTYRGPSGDDSGRFCSAVCRDAYDSGLRELINPEARERRLVFIPGGGCRYPDCNCPSRPRWRSFHARLRVLRLPSIPLHPFPATQNPGHEHVGQALRLCLSDLVGMKDVPARTCTAHELGLDLGQQTLNTKGAGLHGTSKRRALG